MPRLDVAVPMVVVAAASMGKSGYESKAELDADRDFMARLEAVRLAAARLMGPGDASGLVGPKFALLAPPRAGGNICSRYFVPTACHAAHAVTGAICVSCCTALPGSVAESLAVPADGPPPTRCRVEHPSGSIEIALDRDYRDGHLAVNAAGVLRTARKLFSGEIHIPAGVWA